MKTRGRRRTLGTLETTETLETAETLETTETTEESFVMGVWMSICLDEQLDDAHRPAAPSFLRRVCRRSNLEDY